MNDAFSLRSFVETQVEKLSTPATHLVDKFRQTVDNLKLPFSSTYSSEQGALLLTTNDISFNLHPSESISSSSTSSNVSHTRLLNSRLLPTTTPTSMSNMKLAIQPTTCRHAPLRRHASDSNRSDEPPYCRTIFHNNPPIDVDVLLNKTNLESTKAIDRSRSLIRQSTETTCTFPIRHQIRRMESVEIPGLNGVKAIRYIIDDLGKLEPDLYKKQTSSDDSSSDTGQITFTLFYNQSLTSLIITILSADHLPYRSTTSKALPNPFIKLTLLPDRRKKFQTKLYKHTQTVQFDETFAFPIPLEELHKRILLLSIYDFRRSSKRNLIGTVKIEDIYVIPNLTSYDVAFTKDIMPGTEVCSD